MVGGFIAKINPAGSALVYCSAFPMISNFFPANDGGLYFSGSGSTYPAVNVGARFQTAKDYTDALFGKLNASGSAILMLGYVGGSSEDYGTQIAADPAGNLYLGGTTRSSDFPTTPGRFGLHFFDYDIFVTKINSAFDRIVYSLILGTPAQDIIKGLTVDAAGHAYLTGSPGSDVFTTVGGPITSPPGGNDVFAAKVNLTGTDAVYCTYVGGPSADFPGGIAVDPAGNAYVAVKTLISFARNDYDALIAKISAYPLALGPILAFRDNFSRLQTANFPNGDFRVAGGVFASDPAIAVTPARRAYFVARDTAQPTLGGIYLNSLQVDGTFSGWRSLGASAQGNPAITTVGETAYVAIRDQWGAYWTNTFEVGGAVQSWTYLGGILASDPSLASCLDGSVYITGREPYGAIWSRRWDPGTASWRQWTPTGGVTIGKPSVACGSDNAAYIAARDPYGGMWLARTYQETPGTWNSGAGVVSDDPQTLSDAGRIYVFALAQSVPWYRTWTIGTGWQDWTRVGGVLDHMAAAIFTSTVSVTGQSANGDLWRWNGADKAWTNFGNRNVASNSHFSATAR